MKKFLSALVGLCSLASCKGLYDSTIVPVIELSTLNPLSAANWKSTRLTITGNGFPRSGTGDDIEVLVNGVKATDIRSDAEGKTIDCNAPAIPTYEGPARIEIATQGQHLEYGQFSYFGPFERTTVPVGKPAQRIAVTGPTRHDPGAGNAISDLAVSSGNTIYSYQVTPNGKSPPVISASPPLTIDGETISSIAYAAPGSGQTVLPALVGVVSGKVNQTPTTFLKAWKAPRPNQPASAIGYYDMGPDARPYSLITGRFSSATVDDMVVYDGISINLFPGSLLSITGDWKGRMPGLLAETIMPGLPGAPGSVTVAFLAAGDINGDQFDDLLIGERTDMPQTAQGRYIIALGGDKLFPQRPQYISALGPLFPSGIALADFLPSTGPRLLEPCVLLAAAPTGQVQIFSNPKLDASEPVLRLDAATYNVLPAPPSGTQYLTASGAFDTPSADATVALTAADLAVGIANPSAGGPSTHFVRVYMNFRTDNEQRYVDTLLPGKPIAMVSGDRSRNPGITIPTYNHA